jgi:hypothetical protein
MFPTPMNATFMTLHYARFGAPVAIDAIQPKAQ